MTNCKAISCVGVCDVNKVEREGFSQKTHLLWKVFFLTISDLFIDLFFIK